MDVLVYAEGSSAEATRHGVKTLLEKCLGEEKHVVYCVTAEELSGGSWKRTTALLCLAYVDAFSDEIHASVSDYIVHGGHVLTFSSSCTIGGVFVSDLSGAPETAVDLDGLGLHTFSQSAGQAGRLLTFTTPTHGKDFLETLAVYKNGGLPAAVKITSGQGNIVCLGFPLLQISGQSMDNTCCSDDAKAMSSVVTKLAVLRHALARVGLACPARQTSGGQTFLRPGYLLSTPKRREQLLSALSGVLHNGVCRGEVEWMFIDTTAPPPAESSVDLTIDETHFPVIVVDSLPKSARFNEHSYWQWLQTNVLGQSVLYCDVTTSTQTLLNGNYSLVSRLPESSGLVFVATQQTAGKGRRENKWTSPLGCALFSLVLPIAKGSMLLQRLTFIQYMCSLAVVQAVTSLPGYEDLGLRLKWPNDIYCGKKTKIGGVLVNCSSGAQGTVAIVGCGVNISNSQPTTCINDAITQYNAEHGTDLSPLSSEQFIALTLNRMERLVDAFQLGGPDTMLPDYYKFWLHSGAKVTVSELGKELMTVEGLDNDGFLLVRSSSGEAVTVQPDGNSFDMMHNLLVVRRKH